MSLFYSHDILIKCSLIHTSHWHWCIIITDGPKACEYLLELVYVHMQTLLE